MQVRNFSPDDFPSGQNSQVTFLAQRCMDFVDVVSLTLIPFCVFRYVTCLLCSDSEAKTIQLLHFLFGVVCVHKVTSPKS